jgi:hypothetical protein
VHISENDAGPGARAALSEARGALIFAIPRQQTFFMAQFLKGRWAISYSLTINQTRMRDSPAYYIKFLHQGFRLNDLWPQT